MHLTEKIKIVNECVNMIMDKTQVYIEYIQKMCMETVKILKAKEMFYKRLLKINQENADPKERRLRQIEINKYIVSSIPTQEFTSINEFYSFNFLKDIHQNSAFRSMKLADYQQLLKEEYKLPMQADSSRFICLEGHKESIQTVAVTSDNKYIISGGKDKTVRIWSLEKQTQEAVLTGHYNELAKVLVTSDCKYIASISVYGNIHIWNFEKKTQEIQLRGLGSALAITNEMNYIVYSSYDNSVTIYNLELQAVFATLEGHTNQIKALVVSKNNRYIISGSSDKSVRVWNFKDKIQELVIQGHVHEVTGLAISNDNKYIVSACQDVRIFNLETQQCVSILKGHTRPVTYVEISTDINYIVSSDCYNGRIWNLQDKAKSTVLDGISQLDESEGEIIVSSISSSVETLAITSDSKYIISGYSGYLIIVNLKQQNSILQDSNSTIRKVAVSSNNKFIVFGSGPGNSSKMSFDNNVRVWDFEEKTELMVFRGHTGTISDLKISNDSKYIVSGSCDSTIRLWSLKEMKQEFIFDGHHSYSGVNSVAITSDNKFIASASLEQIIRIWSVINKRQHAILQGHSQSVLRLDFTSDNKYIISNSNDRTFRIWNFEERKIKDVVRGINDRESYTITRNNKYIVFSDCYRVIRVLKILSKFKTY